MEKEIKSVRATRLLCSLVLGLVLVIGVLLAFALRPATEVQAINNQVREEFHWPSTHVNYGHDWVNGNYPAGHTIGITVTNSSGAVKATAAVSTTHGGGWGSDGFQTNWEDWSPQQPDIEPGDWVYVQADDGYSDVVHVGTITGEVDVANNTISGTITAAWFTQTLYVDCAVWVQNGPNEIETTVQPDGGSYLCDFDDVGWDLLPGQDVAVSYYEPDSDRVINVFRGPAPDLRVEKWAEGGGEVVPGGPLVFGIRYWNQGDGAGQAVLTDTLPDNTTYTNDSSGFPASVNGNVVTWNLGNVAPYTAPVQFQLVLLNTADTSETLHNVVDIGTLYETNWDNNRAEAEVHVSPGYPDLYVDKWASPGDPAPGQLLRYTINYGNQGPVASGPVWLTDTLPLSTTFVSWESENHYNLWTAVVTSGGQIVLYAPALPGNWGDRIFLTLRLDGGVDYGTQLVNTVEISTAGDSDPNNNTFVNDWTYASPPRYEVSVGKDWGYGRFVPGSETDYWVNYNNGGNLPVHDVVLTDTLPTGTTFITSVLDLGWGIEVPFPPDRRAGNQLVWDLGDLEVGERQNYMVRLQIDSGTTAGTVLTNCATVAMSDFDDNPYNNTMCVTEAVRAAGPNLGVTKFGGWDNPNRIYYDVRIRNIGSETVYNVTVTDTYPASLTLSDWRLDFWDAWSGGVSGNQIVVTLNRLEPGWMTWLHVGLDVPAVPNGTFFTNTARIDTPPGDVYPADNHDTLVVGSGPDLSIEKSLTGGSFTPRPGELLTYTLHLENDSQWWTAGNVWVTDTLPAGLEFITVTQRLCGGTYFCQRDPDYKSGATLAWNNGTWGNWQWNDLVVTVRVTDTVQGGTVLTNTAMIATDDPANDVEPFYGNNTSRVTVTISKYKIYLPLVLKQYP